MELLYADDLVLAAEAEGLLVEMLTKWKVGLEEKGLRVNMGKTKVMRCRDGAGQVKQSGKHPCGICKKGVGSNSIQCTSCNSWIHKRCSGISGKLQNVSGYQCRRCVSGNPSEVLGEISLGIDGRLECVEEFRYLVT